MMISFLVTFSSVWVPLVPCWITGTILGFGGRGATSGSGPSWLRDDQSVSESGMPDAKFNGLTGFRFMGGPGSTLPFFLGDGRFTRRISERPGKGFTGDTCLTSAVLFLQQQYIISKASRRPSTIAIRHQIRIVSFSTFILIDRYVKTTGSIGLLLSNKSQVFPFEWN